jgi:hypothetical protein
MGSSESSEAIDREQETMEDIFEQSAETRRSDPNYLANLYDKRQSRKRKRDDENDCTISDFWNCCTGDRGTKRATIREREE